MAYAKKTRVNVAVQPETAETIKRLARIMDSSLAKLAGSFLDDAQPQLEALADSLEKAKADPSTSMTTLHLAIIEAQRHALQAQADFLEDSQKKSDT